mgnify:CR=1 FL=1|jgi:hypothetical protein
MVYFYKSKYNCGYTSSNNYLGGSIKTQEEKDKAKNQTIIKDLPKEPIKTEAPKIERQNATVNKIVNKKQSEEKLKKFINFKI